MSRASAFLIVPFFAFLGSSLSAGAAVTEAVISVPDQKVVVLEDGEMLKRYPVSTSRFGVGDSCNSYKTPLGRLKVCEKLGENLPTGAVIRHRQATGEVLAANAPGRDPIVTRVLWLDGCEGQNSNARNRSIYIHGTVEESKIGKPVSWGCIRMRSEDVIALFDDLPVGASVTIINEKLPHYAKYSPPKPEPVHQEVLVAKQEPPAPTRSAATTPKAVPAPAVAPVAPAPAPIAEKEQPRRALFTTNSSETASARSATTTPKVAPAPAAAPAPAPASRKAIEVVSTAPVAARKPGDLTQSLRTSILAAGLGDGNSEIPQLRQ